MSGMKRSVGDLVRAMEAIAPPELAEAWDNTGLIVGEASWAIEGPVLLTIDLTDAVLAEAMERKAEAIVAYHPPIFSGVKKLTGSSREGRAVLACAGRGVAVYSPHTALDAAEGGMAEWLVRLAGDGDELTPITAHSAHDPAQTHKIVTFVPASSLDAVREAMAVAGAGVIGDYTRCSYTLEGRGAFLGGAGTNPAVGEAGKLESVEEVRLEMVAPGGSLARVVRALADAHPYEEPAFDMYKLEDRPSAHVGGGRVMTLTAPMRPSEIARVYKERLGVNAIKLAAIDDEPVSRLAACPGAGGSMLDDAVAQGATLFVTGEMRHHEALAALEKGCSVVLAGHTNTERPYLPVLAARLEGFGCVVSERDGAPFVSV